MGCLFSVERRRVYVDHEYDPSSGSVTPVVEDSKEFSFVEFGTSPLDHLLIYT
jgi:hypothetical protein